MSKNFVISNPLFGWKNNDSDIFKMMQDYFNNIFIPLLHKNANKEDTLHITGNIFNGQNINIDILYYVAIILDNISTILPVKVENSKKNYIFKYYPNIEYYDKIDANYEIDGLYQLKRDYKKIGFVVIDEDSGTHKFYENTTSPRFGKVKIDNVDELEGIDKEWVKNNWIELELTENAIEHKLKLDIVLSKFDFKKITYPKDITEPITINDESFDVEELVKEYIDNSENSEELLDEFNKIVELHRNKFHS